MVRLNAAFEILSRAEPRRAYDMWRAGSRVLIRVAAPRDLSRDRHVGNPEQRSDKLARVTTRPLTIEDRPVDSATRCPRGRHCRSGRHRTNAVATSSVSPSCTAGACRHDSSTPPTTARATVVPRTATTTPLRRSTPAPILSRSNAVTATPTRAQGRLTGANACGDSTHTAPTPTPAAARVATPTQAPTPVATGADTPLPDANAAAAGAAPTPTPTSGGGDGRAHSYGAAAPEATAALPLRRQLAQRRRRPRPLRRQRPQRR